jgi:hypothetical protein
MIKSILLTSIQGQKEMFIDQTKLSSTSIVRLREKIRKLPFTGYFALVIAILSSLTAGVQAANWFVRSNATGSQSGADWNNAWSLSGINWSKVGAGDTIWLAGGSYSDLTVGKGGAAGQPITISRVRNTDAAAVAAAGWSNSFDTQVVLSADPSISIPASSYVTIDGRIASGIKLVMPNSGGNQVLVANDANVSNLTFTYIEAIGSSNTSSLSKGRYGFNLIGGYSHSISNLVIDHCIIHQTCEALRSAGWNGAIIQYCTIYDMATDNIDHNDVIYSQNDVNVTWRYNRIYNSPDDGIFYEFGGAVNTYFYGNIFYNAVYAIFDTKAPGTFGPMYIYNNVFAGVDSASQYAFLNFDSTPVSGSKMYNNIFMNCNSGGGGTLASDYNAYYPARVNGYDWPSSEAHSFALTANPFVDSANGDFHLTTAGLAALSNKGIALSADGFINKDMDGNARGNGGWTIGAYQGSSTGAPSAPQNLRVTGSQ